MLSRSPSSRRRSRWVSAGPVRVPGRVVAAPSAAGSSGLRMARLGRIGSVSHTTRAMSATRAAGDAVRPPAGEQLVEQHAQRVDVGGGGHRLAAHLLGAGVLGRHQLQPGRGRRQRLPGHLGIEQLGDAEVEQLGHAVLGDQDVGRLDVAVDDQVLVRVLHRRRPAAGRCRAARRCRARATSAYSTSGAPSTNSITRYGRPSGVVPPSSSRAMFGWSRPARICRSVRKRRTMESVSIPRFRTLRATRLWNASSSRTAR